MKTRCRCSSSPSAVAASVVLVVLAACGGGASAPPAASPQGAAPAAAESLPGAASGAGAAPAGATDAAPAAPTADPKQLVARMRADLSTCFENGRKATPEMSDGKVILNVAVSPAGKATCVVATDGNGLSREVEECMVARAERETYPSGPGYSLAVPIVITAGNIDAAAEAKAPVIEKIEAEGVNGAGTVIQGMMNDLRACVRSGIDKNPAMKGVLYLNAKIGKKGEVVCAVATRADTVPAEVRACAVERISKAKFASPKWGTASLSVPLKVVPSLK